MDVSAKPARTTSYCLAEAVITNTFSYRLYRRIHDHGSRRFGVIGFLLLLYIMMTFRARSITFVFNGSYTGILHFGLHYSLPYSVSLYVLVFTCALIYVASSHHYRH